MQIMRNSRILWIGFLCMCLVGCGSKGKTDISSEKSAPETLPGSEIVTPETKGFNNFTCLNEMNMTATRTIDSKTSSIAFKQVMSVKHSSDNIYYDVEYETSYNDETLESTDTSQVKIYYDAKNKKLYSWPRTNEYGFAINEEEWVLEEKVEIEQVESAYNLAYKEIVANKWILINQGETRWSYECVGTKEWFVLDESEEQSIVSTRAVIDIEPETLQLLSLRYSQNTESATNGTSSELSYKIEMSDVTTTKVEIPQEVIDAAVMVQE